MDFQDIEDIEAAQAAAAAAAAASDNEEVFEEELAPPKGGKTAHHIRANSSIMHLKKLLGKSDFHGPRSCHHSDPASSRVSCVVSSLLTILF